MHALMAWMLLAITAVALVAYWDEQREFGAALTDFAGEQTALAQAVGTTLRARLVGVDASELPSGADRSVHSLADVQMRFELALQTEQFLLAVRAVERPNLVRLFVQGPFGLGLFTSDGHLLRAPALEAGLANGLSSTRLTRQDAAALGLPERTAMAGFTRIDAGPAGHWGIAVVASARRERDREVLAEWRLALSVVVASGLVLAFGGLALRNQRRQMLLSQELAIASLQSERDERLVRADKLATMGALAMGIAHEVSTPLGVILGRAEQLLARPNGDERAKRAAEAIAEQAERISGIVRGFLALARGDSPRTELVAPRALAEVALDLVGHRFAKAGVGLSRSFAQNLPNVSCEPRLMEQVLVNLLLNACDACEPGGQVELRVVAEEQRVAFVVTDDGSGISADAAARIMDPFFTTKPIGEGSGLGLAIANELVKHHRGTLTVVARREQRGTRACVELPNASEPSRG
ncbi:MAG TPA: ATP-binding protein [Polyangiaceae bacterium]|jgi:two-component system NtrC family sensor kinase|nr:ATP-binding protein [Polyangiaceae bacterium]